MIIQTNWNADLNKIKFLFEEVNHLKKRYGGLFDWRILTHPVKKFNLKKVLNKKDFIVYLNKSIKSSMDKTIIEIYNNHNKKTFHISDLKTTNPGKFMWIKQENYVKKSKKHAHYYLTKEGYEYLIGKIYPLWCRFNKTNNHPIQRTIIYRLLSYNRKSLPTQENFSSALGYTQSWFVNYERAKDVISPLNTKKFMKEVRGNYGKQIEKNFEKPTLIEIFNLLGKNRHKQICRAAKLIHPTLRNKLTPEQYRIYQTKRIKNSPLSVYEKKIKALLKYHGIKDFEVHPYFGTYHFDFLIPNKKTPRILIEFVSNKIDTTKIKKIKKSHHKITTIAIVQDKVKNNVMLRLDYYFDYVFRFSDITKCINLIKSAPKVRKKLFNKRIHFIVGKTGSDLWQGFAENSIRTNLIKNKFKENSDFYHELPLIGKEGNKEYKFLPDFIFLDKNRNPKIILEALTIYSRYKQNVTSKLARLTTKLDIYKNILQLNAYCVVAIIIKDKNINYDFEIQKLKEQNLCDKVLLNEEIKQLPLIIKNIQNGNKYLGTSP